jgi:hypothetical protein
MDCGTTRNFSEIKKDKFDEEGVSTTTSQEQVSRNNIKLLRFSSMKSIFVAV